MPFIRSFLLQVDDISSDALSESSIELLIEMMNGGNMAVANTLYGYIMTNDHEGD